MALFEITSKKQKFNPTGNYAKTSYNKATTICRYYKKTFHKVVEC